MKELLGEVQLDAGARKVVRGRALVVVAAGVLAAQARPASTSLALGQAFPASWLLAQTRGSSLALRLRGGSLGGGGVGAFSDANRGVADEDEFFRKFGSGPKHMDMSSSKFEVKPDSFNDTESLMDGMGLWDYPEDWRLLGEHIPARVGHRVRSSPLLRVMLYGLLYFPWRR